MFRTSHRRLRPRIRLLVPALVAAAADLACAASTCPPGQPQCARLCIDPVNLENYCYASGGIPAKGTCSSLIACQEEIWVPQLSSGAPYSSSAAPGWEPSTAISGDTVALVSGHPSLATVQVFTRKDGVWGKEATVAPTTEEPYLAFGPTSVALSGETFAAGIPHLGAVLVYTRTSGVWTLQARLDVPSPGPQYDMFGTSVALEGDTLVVGAPSDDRGATSGPPELPFNTEESGAVYLFGRTGSTWAQTAFLKAPAPWRGDHFGQRVALSGDSVAVGAPGDTSAASGVNGPPSPKYNSSEGPSGAVYVFERTSDGWSQQAFLKPDTPRSSAGFGLSVGLEGDALVVGAPYLVGGAVFGFARSEGSWAQEAFVAPSHGQCFGSSVALRADKVAVGRCGRLTYPYHGWAAHDVWLLARSQGGWSRVRTFAYACGGSDACFGNALALGADALVVTSPRANDVYFLRP